MMEIGKPRLLGLDSGDYRQESRSVWRGVLGESRRLTPAWVQFGQMHMALSSSGVISFLQPEELPRSMSELKIPQELEPAQEIQY